jgi:hypothetical protein
MAQPGIETALDRLDPVDRAVLELSERRGLPDEEVAGIVGVSPRAVARRRRSAVDRIAVAMGAADTDDRATVERELSRLLSEGGGRPVPGAAQSVPAAAASRSDAVAEAAEGTSRTGWLALFVAALVLARSGRGSGRSSRSTGGRGPHA